MTRHSRKKAAGVVSGVVEQPVAKASGSERGERTNPPKRGRAGAPKGNVNAARDPSFTREMRKAKQLAKRGQSRRRAAHMAEAKRIIAEVGLADSPLGARLAQRFCDVEVEVTELRGIIAKVGRMKRDGSLSPALEKYLALQGQDRAELRALVDRLAELHAKLAAKPDGDVTYIAVLSDGTPLHDDAAATLPTSTPENDPPAPLPEVLPAPEAHDWPREGPIVEGVPTVTAGRVKREQAVIEGVIAQRREAERKRRTAFLRGDDLED